MDEIALRHQFHQCAEFSGKEQKTQALILEKLRLFSPTQIFTFENNYNILVLYHFSDDGDTVLLRSDFDAVGVNETLNLPYQSVTEGVSHKCGHDGHTTIMLAVAEKLHLQPLKKGNILLFFQGCEEIGKGAEQLLQSHILKSYSIDRVYALHNIPGYPLNSIICKSGSFTCSVISCDIQLNGTTAHAAEPLNGISPLDAAIEITQHLLSQNCYDISSDNYQIATFIEFHIGEARYGVSAGNGILRFTIRAAKDEKLQFFIHSIEAFVNQTVAKTKGLQSQIRWLEYFASTNNSPIATQKIMAAAKRLRLPIVSKEDPFSWGEDFGLLTQHFQGAMFGIGSGENCFPLHHNQYDFPDEIIRNAANLFYELLNS